MQAGKPLDTTELSKQLKGTNLYLIGMMGSGKTTIGRLLAAHLGYQFFDTDAVIEQTTGRTITEIFAESGEPAFRELETQVLAELSPYKKLAIATGGGIILQRKNWSYLHHGIILWLDVPIDQLFKRIKNSTTRPLIQHPNPKQKLQDLLDQRQSLYALADIHVTVNGNEPPEQVANRALEKIYSAVQTKLAEQPNFDH